MLHKIFEFLFSLDKVSLEDLSRVRLTFDFPNYWLLMLFIGAVLGLLGFWSYQGQSASPAKRIGLGILRGAILVALLALVLRPHLMLEESKPLPSVIAIWVDDSAPMAIRDPYKDPATLEGLSPEELRARRAVRDQAQKLMAKLNAGATQPAKAKWPKRWDMALDTLLNDKDLHDLARSQEIAVFTGHDEAIALGRAATPEQLDAILNRMKDTNPVGARTDIPKIVKRIFSDLQGQPISSIMMFTDGRSTPGGDKIPEATEIAKLRGVPIIPFAMGSIEPLVDASVETMDVAEDVFVKDPVLVKVHLKITADRAGTTHVTLYRRPAGAKDDKGDTAMKTADDKDVSETVDYIKGTQEKDVELIFKPMKIAGENSEVYHLVAKVDSIGEELSADNNVKEAQTTVMDAKVNVLYVEGYPRWEYRYLKNELLREGTINVSVLLLSADESFSQEGTVRKNADGSIHKLPDGTDDIWTIQRFPETEEEMLKYDVILLGDVEPDFFSPSQMQLVLNFVKKHGGGIGWIAGDQYNPNSYKDTALLPLLPIDPDDQQHPSLPPSRNVEFKVQATPEGYNTPLFRFFDTPELNKKQMAENPSMYWYKPVLGPHGPVQVLAEHPSDTAGGQKMPLLVYGQYGDGRVLFSGIADTWRWRRYKGEPLYQSYWLQVCRMLYAGRVKGQNHKVELLANGRSATVNQPMPLMVTIHDPTMLPAAPPQLTIRVTDDAGNPLEPVVLSRVGENGNTYTGELTSDTVGKLHLQVAPGSMSVEPTPLELLVGGPNDTVVDPTIDMKSLNTFAGDTHGQVLMAEQAGDLIKLVANKSIMQLKIVGEDLWTKPFALVIIVIMLVVEWLLRKQSGLI